MGHYKFSTTLLYQTFIYTEKSGDWWNWNKKTWFWHTYIYEKYKYIHNSCMGCITKTVMYPCVRTHGWALVPGSLPCPPPPRNPRGPLCILKRHHWIRCAGGGGKGNTPEACLHQIIAPAWQGSWLQGILYTYRNEECNFSILILIIRTWSLSAPLQYYTSWNAINKCEVGGGGGEMGRRVHVRQFYTFSLTDDAKLGVQRWEVCWSVGASRKINHAQDQLVHVGCWNSCLVPRQGPHKHWEIRACIKHTDRN